MRTFSCCEELTVCTVQGRPRPQGPTRPVGIWSVKGLTEIHIFLCQDNDVRQTRSFHHIRTFCRLVNRSMGKSGLRTQSDCQPSPGTQLRPQLSPRTVTLGRGLPIGQQPLKPQGAWGWTTAGLHRHLHTLEEDHRATGPPAMRPETPVLA